MEINENKNSDMVLKIILAILIIMLIFVISFVIYHKISNNKDSNDETNNVISSNENGNEPINKEDNPLEIEQIFKIGFVKEQENESANNEYLTIPNDIRSNVIAVKAASKGTSVKDIYEIDNTISIGSKIYVPEGKALITIMNNKITGIIAEPGMYTLKKKDSSNENESNISMIYLNNSNLSSNIKQSFEESINKNIQEIDGNQLAFFVNLNEMNLQSSYNEIKTNYSIVINNPIIFVESFVPERYLKNLAKEYAFDDTNEASTLLNNEVLSTVMKACESNSNCYDNSYQQQIINEIYDTYLWEKYRGIKITKIKVEKIAS